jgi:glycosyltransferase involved in cell wall biosynthesis
MTPLRYLTFDSLAEGVGRSQVLPYVERLAQHTGGVELHSFEKTAADADVARRLALAGVSWHPHRFGSPGALAGGVRTLRAARAVQGHGLLHARSDLAAASAMLARARPWVWDVRSFWADQRIALGSLRPGSPQERVLRSVERRAARESAAITALSASAIDTLVARHGEGIRDKAWVVTTCVDLDRFPLEPMPDLDDGLVITFSGTMNSYYDAPTMLALVDCLNVLLPARLVVLAPAATAWDGLLASRGVATAPAPVGTLPRRVAEAHVGLAVCRADAGPSLAAAMPTKVGEFLASGRPVVVNAGLGDLDALLPRGRAGVVLRSSSPADLEAAAGEIVALIEDPETPVRCRALAEQHFDLDVAVRTLLEVYDHATSHGS